MYMVVVVAVRMDLSFSKRYRQLFNSDNVSGCCRGEDLGADPTADALLVLDSGVEGTYEQIRDDCEAYCSNNPDCAAFEVSTAVTPRCELYSMSFLAVQVLAGSSTDISNRCRTSNTVETGCFIDSAKRFCVDDALFTFRNASGEELQCPDVVEQGLCEEAGALAASKCCGCGGGTQCPGQRDGYSLSKTNVCDPKCSKPITTKDDCRSAAIAIGNNQLGFALLPNEPCVYNEENIVCGTYIIADNGATTYVRGCFTADEENLFFNPIGISTPATDDGTRHSLCSNGPAPPELLNPCDPAVSLNVFQDGSTRQGDACPTPLELARDYSSASAPEDGGACCFQYVSSNEERVTTCSSPANGGSCADFAQPFVCCGGDCCSYQTTTRTSADTTTEMITSSTILTFTTTTTSVTATDASTITTTTTTVESSSSESAMWPTAVGVVAGVLAVLLITAFLAHRRYKAKTIADDGVARTMQFDTSYATSSSDAPKPHPPLQSAKPRFMEHHDPGYGAATFDAGSSRGPEYEEASSTDPVYSHASPTHALTPRLPPAEPLYDQASPRALKPVYGRAKPQVDPVYEQASSGGHRPVLVLESSDMTSADTLEVSSSTQARRKSRTRSYENLFAESTIDVEVPRAQPQTCFVVAPQEGNASRHILELEIDDEVEKLKPGATSDAWCWGRNLRTQQQGYYSPFLVRDFGSVRRASSIGLPRDTSI